MTSDPAAPKATILLADDERAVRLVGRLTLEHLGYRVVLAANGEEAVEAFENEANRIDVAMLDIAMPRLNGNEACTRIRQIQSDVPVIFCSGYADDARLARIHAAGFTGFLHKPYRRQQLVEMLDKALASVADTGTGSPDTQ